MMKFTISNMQKQDIDGVFSLEKLIHPMHHWSKDSFYNEISNNLAFYTCIRNESGVLAGYSGIWKIIDEAHITTLAVHPDFRQMQLGCALMINIIEECFRSMIKYITLEVRESNAAAIGLYEKFLFESIGVRKKYYQDNNENALIMFTQNIWYDKFKNNFEKVKAGINKIEIIYAE